MGRTGSKFTFRQHWVAAFAAVALLLQISVPQGFMVAGGADRPTLTLCTGHGPLLIEGKVPAPAPPKSRHDAPCAFAGHGTALAPPGLIAVMGVAVIDPDLARGAAEPDLVPGRGLAAPPPPSQGPPLSL